MPEVFADEQCTASPRDVEGAHLVATGKVPLFIKHTVRREIDFTMHVTNLSIGQIDRRVIELIIGAFFNKANNKRYLPAPFPQLGYFWRIKAQRYCRHHVAEVIPGQVQLWEDKEMKSSFSGAEHIALTLGEIRLQITKARGHLRDSDSKNFVH
jgi:hypothetical protein